MNVYKNCSGGIQVLLSKDLEIAAGDTHPNNVYDNLINSLFALSSSTEASTLYVLITFD